MSESIKSTAKLFSIIFETLSSMDDHEIGLLMEGKATLRVVERNRASRLPVADASIFNEAISETAQKLASAESREGAVSVLASINQPRRKDFLIQLAKSCGVRIDSKDSIAIIEQKLVENVVGARLDSEAIKKVAF